VVPIHNPVLFIDLQNETIKYAGHPVKLSPKAYQVFVLLADPAKTLRKYDYIIQNVWGYAPDDEQGDDNLIDNARSVIRKTFQGLSGKSGVSPARINHILKTENKGLLLNLEPEDVELARDTSRFKPENS
jgi:DNA-binding response OmpR family regulator